ncbi:MAG: hypothetical protein LBR80_14855 [Deltaproteobacteria bacterium]|jgi:hypothetical protein|nr:hypothetical protein [Deltaproteobacteria bacterium]
MPLHFLIDLALTFACLAAWALAGGTALAASRKPGGMGPAGSTPSPKRKIQSGAKSSPSKGSPGAKASSKGERKRSGFAWPKRPPLPKGWPEWRFPHMGQILEMERLTAEKINTWSKYLFTP